jgi:hypothetical protein
MLGEPGTKPFNQSNLQTILAWTYECLDKGTMITSFVNDAVDAE